MPKPTKTADETAATEEPKADVPALRAFTVFIHGEARTVMAKDEADRDAQIARMRETFAA